jgi:VIT1/CCC1 family predicted Fe2+/Mn2+ transporter
LTAPGHTNHTPITKGSENNSKRSSWRLIEQVHALASSGHQEAFESHTGIAERLNSYASHAKGAMVPMITARFGAQQVGTVVAAAGAVCCILALS